MMKTGAELSRSDRIFTIAHRSTLLARLVLCFTSPLSQIFSFICGRFNFNSELGAKSPRAPRGRAPSNGRTSGTLPPRSRPAKTP